MKYCKWLVGETYGHLTVTRFSHKIQRKIKKCRVWLVKCKCGKEFTRPEDSLTKNKSMQSCGCLTHLQKKGMTHGLCKHPSYQAWRGMMTRCYNTKDISYRNYGGRGISVCERWHDVKNFCADMGERPSKSHSLDRINNDGNYEPENCRWASIFQQAKNKRTNHKITFHGVTRTITDWCRSLGSRDTLIIKRLRMGWSIERALTEGNHTYG